MKYCVINSVYRPDTRGGAEVVVENIVKGFQKKGEGFFAISVGRENKVEEVDGVRVYRIKPFNFFNFLDIDKKPIYLRLFWHVLDMFNDIQTWRIFKVLEKEKPDVVFTHNLKGLGYYIPWMLKILKIKQVHTVHDMQLFHPSGLLKKNPLPIYSWLCRKLFGNPKVVIFPSEYIKGVYEKYNFFPKSKKVVLGNPVEVKSQKLKVESLEKFQILFLGQIEEYKGILDLIKSVKNISKDFTLHVVGDGKVLESAKKLTGDDKRIIFHGRMSHDEMEEKIWPNINLLVNPSQTPESFGMVVLESFVHGVPVLASNIGALPELVSDGEDGWIIRGNNWQEKIEWCIENKEKLGDIRENCFQKAKEYNIDEYLNKLVEFGKMG